MSEINITNRIESFKDSLVKGKDGQNKPESSFSQILNHSIGTVNRLQKEADRAVKELTLGNNKDIHGTMIALEKADVSFQLMMQVRNKIVSAYQEIIRMQV